MDLCGRHEILRTRIAARDGATVQVIEAAVEAPWSVLAVHASHGSEERREAAALALAGAEVCRHLEPDAHPPWRACLIHVQPRRHLLVLSFHPVLLAHDALAEQVAAELLVTYAAGGVGSSWRIATTSRRHLRRT